MALIEQAQVKIERVNSSGLGEGRTELGPVELPYVLPGDVAEFERHAYRGKSDTILKNIVEKNAPRKEAVCQYFGACGGCLLQHFPDEDYKQFKVGLLESVMATPSVIPAEAGTQFLNNLNTGSRVKPGMTTLGLGMTAIDDAPTIFHPLITVPFGQRRRANLNAVKKGDQIFLGFHRFHSHQIINLDHCPSLLPELSALIAPLKKVLEAIMEDREKLVMFVTKAASGIDVSIEIHNRTSLEDHKRILLKQLAAEHNVARLIFRYRKRIDVIHGDEVPYVLFDGVKVEIDSHCFLQSSDMSDAVLGDMVVKYLVGDSSCESRTVIPAEAGTQFLNNLNTGSRVKPGMTTTDVELPTTDAEIPRNDVELATSRNDDTSPILDLFCGRGTYTIPLSKYTHVDGFECDAKALKALGEAAQKNKLPITLQQRDLFSYPLQAYELTKYTKCIINPPRAGAEAQIREIVKSNIKQICYVSCSPETFARDAKILTDVGFNLREVTPFDQFYYSPHLEVVGYFER